jgi:hypothetical protein
MRHIHVLVVGSEDLETGHTEPADWARYVSYEASQKRMVLGAEALFMNGQIETLWSSAIVDVYNEERLQNSSLCTYSNIIFLPFNSVPPTSFPTANPIYAPVTIVTGHFCHSRSLQPVSTILSKISIPFSSSQ